MLKSAILPYINLIEYFETDLFKFNPYVPYVANNTTEWDPLTSVFHIDDLKASHRKKNVVYNFKQWIEFMYGDTEIKKVKSVRRKVHE